MEGIRKLYDNKTLWFVVVVCLSNNFIVITTMRHKKQHNSAADISTNILRWFSVPFWLCHSLRQPIPHHSLAAASAARKWGCPVLYSCFFFVIPFLALPLFVCHIFRVAHLEIISPVKQHHWKSIVVKQRIKWEREEERGLKKLFPSEMFVFANKFERINNEHI